MAGLPLAAPQSAPSLRARLLRLVSSRGFQAMAARTPVLRRFVRAEGAALFDIVAGFVNSQTLMALVELRVLHLLHDGALSTATLARRCDIPEARLQVLLQAGAALGLLRRERDGGFSLGLRGAAMIGVPGLEAMVRHHCALYADLADPVAFWRQGQNTELARFWPYVFGASGAVDPEITATYSRLMADSQALVAEDTLRMVDLRGVRQLLDIGGGTGTFLCAAGKAFPALHLSLFDLPVVVANASARMNAAGLANPISIHPGSFRDDPLPRGADAISLIRVLYDHDDSTVTRLLASVYEALPPGGRLIISEPMSGGAKPDRATDVYFSIYTLAMQTGRTRSLREIGALLAAAGYINIRETWGYRPFVTSTITAARPLA
jgi:demethylspheroidene O-methyltransferase